MTRRAAAPERLLNRNMVLVWQGAAESKLGSVLYAIAIGVWVYHQTGSTALMGTVSSISYFGALVLQPFGGVLADRFNKRNLMVGTDVLCGMTFLWLAWFALRGEMTTGQVLLAASVSALCSGVFGPASSSILPQVAPPDQLMQANSLMQGTNSTLQMLGNAAGGFLVAAVGAPALILFNALTFLLSALTECFIRVPHIPAETAASPSAVLRELWDGLGYLRRRPGLLAFLLAASGANLLGAGFSGVVYAWCLAKGATVEQYGLFLGAESAAMLVGTLLLSVRPMPHRHRYRVFASTTAVQCGFYIAAMAADGFGICTALYAVSTLFNTISCLFIYPAIMEVTAPEYQGRVIALVGALCSGGIGLSMVGYGVLAERFGMETVCLVGAMLCVLPNAALCWNRTMRAILS